MTPRRNLEGAAILVVAVLAALLGPASSAVVPFASGRCKFSINKDLPVANKQPLIIDPNTNQFLYPQKSDTVEVQLRQHVRLLCLGKNNYFEYAYPQKVIDVSPHCVTNNVFSPGNGYVYEIKKMGCQTHPQAVAVKNGKCLNRQTRIKVGFELPGGGFASTMDLCYDEKNYDALYSSFEMTPSIIGRQHNISRPLFDPSNFYPSVDISGLYRRETQRQIISNILGSEKLGAQYVKGDKNYYLARGHLTAKADFVYGSEQQSTFFYMNTAPQWQIFNAGNWEKLESSVREFVSKRSSGVTVVTGIWGTCNLPDVNNNPTPLYLHSPKSKKGVKVPGYFWKIVYDPKTKKGVAFVGINNPYLSKVTNQDIFCKDVCKNFPWLKWDQKNIKQGYSFCCSVDDFRKTVTVAPDFKVNGLLS